MNKQDKIEILLNEPLRGLPNNISDEIDFENKKIIRKVGKRDLDDKKNFATTSTQLTNTMSFYTDFNLGRYGGSVITNKLSSREMNVYSSYDDEAVFSINNGASNFLRLVIRINKSRLTTLDVAGFKQWLQENPITVYYELAEPTIEDIQIDKTKLRTFDERTHIFTEGSSIEPIIETKIPSDVNAVIRTLGLENEELNKNVICLNEENEELKEDSLIHSELIDISMSATVEVYNMIEPILEMLPMPMALNIKNEEQKGGSKMVDLYVAMIIRGVNGMTIDDVPARYKEQVREILAKLEK